MDGMNETTKPSIESRLRAWLDSHKATTEAAYLSAEQVIKDEANGAMLLARLARLVQEAEEAYSDYSDWRWCSSWVGGTSNSLAESKARLVRKATHHHKAAILTLQWIQEQEKQDQD